MNGTQIGDTSTTSTFANTNPALPWILAASMLIGTGGVMNENALTPMQQTGTAISVRFRPATTRDSKPVFGAPEQIIAIRRFLSLNITDLAKVLRVGRPTVYSWLKEESVPHASNLERIALIHGIAKHWRSISSIPVGDLLVARTDTGATLLELLSQDTLDQHGLRHALLQVYSGLTQARRRSVVETANVRGARVARRDVSSDELFNL